MIGKIVKQVSNDYNEANSLTVKIADLSEELDYYKAKYRSLEEGLFEQNREISKLKKENKQLQQELFESEYECIWVHYHDNEFRRDDRIEDLKEEFKERFGRDFE